MRRRRGGTAVNKQARLLTAPPPPQGWRGHQTPNTQEQPGLRKGLSPQPCLWQVHGVASGEGLPEGPGLLPSDISSSSINSKGGTGRV